MERKTNILASGSDPKGETPRKQVKGTQTDPTPLPETLTPYMALSYLNRRMRIRMSGGVRGGVGNSPAYSICC